MKLRQRVDDWRAGSIPAKNVVREETSRSRGRMANAVYELAWGHPLRGIHNLKARSKLLVPKCGGKRPPNPPAQLNPREQEPTRWMDQQRMYASFMISNFVPWPTAKTDSKPSHDKTDLPDFLPIDVNEIDEETDPWPPASACVPGPPNLMPETFSLWLQRQ